jgi:hypothetical protein
MPADNLSIIFITQKTKNKLNKLFNLTLTEKLNINSLEEQKMDMKNGGAKMEFKVQLDSKVQKKKEKSLVK